MKRKDNACPDQSTAIGGGAGGHSSEEDEGHGKGPHRTSQLGRISRKDLT